MNALIANLGIVGLSLGVLLLPAGLFFAVVGLKRQKCLTALLGLLMACLSVPSCFFIGAFVLYRIDAARGWELKVTTTVADYDVTLIQKPGFDFYETYFEVVRHDGKRARIWIDPDDGRYMNPGIVRREGKIYFTRGWGGVDSLTPYIDPQQQTIVVPLYQTTCVLSELDFSHDSSEI